MTNVDLLKYRNILVDKLAELSVLVRNREGIVIEKNADAMDEVQSAAERELAIRNLDRDSQLLSNVRAALLRTDKGRLGVCLQCDEDINPKRLNAVPWTPLCITCQAWADQQQGEEDESPGFECQPVLVI